jgi:putative endonuclease
MPSEASAKEDRPLYYVYLIESLSAQGERYLGMTSDLKQRLQEHNAGKSSHTSKFRPWKLKTYIAFTDRAKAGAFERYLKSGSGRAFARKHLWYALRSISEGGSTNPWRLRDLGSSARGQLGNSGW